jgi:signal transduction histidine kinase
VKADDLLTAVRDAGDDARAVRLAVRRAGKAMVAPGVDRKLLAHALLPLASHDDERVRQEVAEICDLFPPPFFERAYEALARDRHALVSGAAQRAAERYRREEEDEQREEERGAEREALLRELEARFGPEARALAEEASRQGTFDDVVRLHHELGRSVRLVDRELGGAERAAERLAPPPQVLLDYMAAAREAFRHLAGVLDKWFALARAARPVCRSVGLRELAMKARETVRAVVPGVEMAVDVDDGVELEADETLLLQALENILKNAAEAQRGRAGRARVTCALSLGGAVVELAVEDTGVGMTKEEQAQIYVRSGSQKPGGMGVGMRVARAIVLSHDGKITITSELGRGTRVVVRLPRKQVKR